MRRLAYALHINLCSTDAATLHDHNLGHQILIFHRVYVEGLRERREYPAQH